MSIDTKTIRQFVESKDAKMNTKDPALAMVQYQNLVTKQNNLMISLLCDLVDAQQTTLDKAKK